MLDKAYSFDPQLGCAPIDSALSAMGFDDLRPGQAEAVRHLLTGEDLVCVLPTGFGKTGTFVIPALCHGWRTLVFSPLIALQKDQVDGLIKKEISAGVINSQQTEQSNEKLMGMWRDRKLQFLYVSPERLSNATFFKSMVQSPPDFVVIDEAHCVSDWGDSFRADYMKIGDLIAAANPKCVAAFTATCMREESQDIRRVFGLSKARLFLYLPRRNNLHLRGKIFVGDQDLINEATSMTGSTIVYCGSRKGTEELASQFSVFLPKNQYCSFYHADLSPAQRTHTQNAFMDNAVRYMCATNAFGMGIDKPDIRGVIHKEAPKAMTALIQEIGRAGRDGKDSVCLTYDNPDATKLAMFFIEAENPTRREIEDVWSFLRSAADAEGQVQMTIFDVATKMRVHKQKLTSVFEILRGAQCIERQHESDKLARIKFLITPDELPGLDQRYNAFHCQTVRYGETTPEGHIISLFDLAAALGVKEPTVRNYCKAYHKDGRIDFSPPYSGKTTRLTGDLTAVDFDRLQRRKERALKKFRAVTEYLRTDNSEKHLFIEDYFTRQEAAL